LSCVAVVLVELRITRPSSVSCEACLTLVATSWAVGSDEERKERQEVVKDVDICGEGVIIDVCMMLVVVGTRDLAVSLSSRRFVGYVRAFGPYCRYRGRLARHPQLLRD
jgi:hypothetical protein